MKDQTAARGCKTCPLDGLPCAGMMCAAAVYRYESGHRTWYCPLSVPNETDVVAQVVDREEVAS